MKKTVQFLLHFTLAFLPMFLFATNYTWNFNAVGNWNTATNWTPNGVPGAGDNVNTNSAGIIALTNDVTVINFTSNGATVTGYFNINISGTLSFSGFFDGVDTISVTGATTFPSGLPSLFGGSILMLNGGGTINPNREVRLSGGSQIVIPVDQTLTKTTSADETWSTGNGGTLVINGTFIKAGPGRLSLEWYKINCTGTINVNEGNLFHTLNGGTNTFNGADITIASSFFYGPNGGSSTFTNCNVSGAGSFGSTGNRTIASGNTITSHMYISGGTHTINQSISPASYNISNGTLNGTGSITTIGNLTMSGGSISNSNTWSVGGTFTWTGGTFGGVSTATVSGATTFPNSAQTVVLDGRTLILNGDATFSNGTIDLNNNAILRNSVGATLTVNNTSPTSLLAGGVFENQGIVLKTGASNLTISCDLVNTGTLKGSGPYAVTTAGFTNTGIIAPGSPLGILNMSNNLNLGSGTLEIEILDGSGAGTGHDKLSLVGNVTLTNTTLLVTELGCVPNGSYIFLTWTGTRSNDFAVSNLPTGYSVVYDEILKKAEIIVNRTEVCDGFDNDCDGEIDEEVQSTFYADTDSDGFGDNNNTVLACSAPMGYVLDNTDCDDTDAAINPSATEICNDLDDNCDGQIDEGVQSTFYADADGDGYGDAAVSQMACSAPTGFVNDNTDCNDNNAQIHPGAQEACNGFDDDCDGLVDEGVMNTYYADADGDGYGNTAISQDACSAPNGYVLDNTDCDDTKPGVNPGASEICNGIDDDCDGLEDEGVQSTFYADADWDGYGDPNVTMQSCGPDEGFVANNTDCDDTNPNIHDGAAEICNGLDDDCDGLIDEDVLSTFYADNDGDGYGDLNITTLACSAPPGYVNDPNDCNDSNDQIHPGAPETCNGLDDDCDGLVDEGDICDGDGDGYTIAEGDCDDSNPNIHPGAIEICNNLDDDCDGLVDDNVGTTWYADADGDGYGDASDSQTACSQPEGYVNNANDCNDENDQIHPGATEMCNGLDDNCDGQVDETTLNLSLSAGNILCNGGSTTITASGTGGAPPYLYSFNGGSFGTSNNFSATAGSHDVSIKDANNCLVTNTIDIDEPEIITIDPIEITHVACSGGNTGAINITVSGGTAAYTYRWSNNRTTQDLINVSGNTYSVTVADANACTASASATVNPRLALTLTKTNVICNGGSDGTATATATAGTPDYSYEWSNGETTETITGLSAGTYTCTVMDALGCTRSKSVHVGQPSAIAIFGTVTKVDCHGAATGSIAITINNGVAPFTFNWSDGESTEDRSGLEAGSYTLSVTDANGCTREKSFNVTQPTALTLNLSVDNVNCHGAADGTILASVTGGVKFSNSNLCKGERYCFEWSHGDTARITSGLETGIYTVSVTDANGCSITGSATVTEPSLLEITEVLVESLPNGKYKLTVTVEGGTPTYKYRRIPGGSYQNSNVFNNVPSGTYEIVVRDLNLCTDTTTVDLGNAGNPGNPDERQDAGDVLMVDSNNPVSAYPNPASERFHLLVEKEYTQATVMIFNAQGQVMEERNFEANADLGSYEVNTWKSGLYLIVVYIDGERFAQKVVLTQN